MDLTNYINAVLSNRKNIFCDVEMDDGFDKNNLKRLCDIKISKKRLIIAWSIIIDFLNDNYRYDINDFLTDEILIFLIENNICLNDLGHLKISEKYLKMIYEKDNTCWEAMENLRISSKK